MYETLVSIRNRFIHFYYTAILKRIFFRQDPEKVHDRLTAVGRFLGSRAWTRALTGAFFRYADPSLEQTIRGVKFPNPVGLAAGFDKDAVLTDILPEVGFGFAEVGSITGDPCEGNPKPRLWRLKKSKSLVVYYGLKNAGCERISERLAKKTFRIPVGISVAKTNCPRTVETREGVADYVKAFKAFADIGAYFTVNISCPNAFGGQPFTDPASLDLLLSEIDRVPTPKPIFFKLSPDLSLEDVDRILEVASRHRVHGYICTNLTKKRDNPKIADEPVPGKGGLSGKVVEGLSDALISHVYSRVRGKAVVIGCGGVFSAEDAYRKIRLGASLVQLITGMIFEGPQVISGINLGLVRLLRRDGLKSISDAVGADAGK